MILKSFEEEFDIDLSLSGYNVIFYHYWDDWTFGGSVLILWKDGKYFVQDSCEWNPIEITESEAFEYIEETC